MKTKLGIALGVAVATAIYEVARHGVSQIDWLRIIVVPAITFVLLLLVPGRWLETKKPSDS